MTKIRQQHPSEAASAGVDDLITVQRMSIAWAALNEAASLISLAKKELDELSPRVPTFEWMNDPGKYGWWYDTNQALKSVRKWAKLIRKHGMYP